MTSTFDRRSRRAANDELVRVVVVRPGAMFTPCESVGVGRFGMGIKRRQRVTGHAGWRLMEVANDTPSSTTGPDDRVSDGGEWAEQSWATLQGWMSDNPE
jgi:hypothetical protein